MNINAKIMITAGAIGILSVFVLCACSPNENVARADVPPTFKLISSDSTNNDSNGDDTGSWHYIYEDTQTGVEYIVFEVQHGVSITPRLSASGQVITVNNP